MHEPEDVDEDALALDVLFEAVEELLCDHPLGLLLPE
jgi:hypothetical protein